MTKSTTLFKIDMFFEVNGEKMATVSAHNFAPMDAMMFLVRAEDLIRMGQMCKDHEMGLARDMTEKEKHMEMERMKRMKQWEEDEAAEEEEEYRQSLDEPDFDFEDSFYGEQK